MSRLSAAQRAAPATFARLKDLYPDAHCELIHSSPFELLVATVLSAQTTDRLVNTVTPELFKRFPTPAALAAAHAPDVATLLRSLGMGMHNQKAKNIVGLARLLVERHAGEVPRSMHELTALPGVGRKTANVVLGVAFNAAEGVVVDTHVQRLAQRLGWSRETTPERIEGDLLRMFPQEAWEPLPHVLIFHGRRVCAARAPACATCGIASLCPSAGNAVEVGRKAAKNRPAQSGKAPASKTVIAKKAAPRLKEKAR